MMEGLRPVMRVGLVVDLVMCSLKLQWRAHWKRMVVSEAFPCRLLHGPGSSASSRAIFSRPPSLISVGERVLCCIGSVRRHNFPGVNEDLTADL
jgi:hypothetical protein